MATKLLFFSGFCQVFSYLVGGSSFNPFEKMRESNWINSPTIGVKIKPYLKAPPSFNIDDTNQHHETVKRLQLNPHVFLGVPGHEPSQGLAKIPPTNNVLDAHKESATQYDSPVAPSE